MKRDLGWVFGSTNRFALASLPLPHSVGLLFSANPPTLLQVSTESATGWQERRQRAGREVKALLRFARVLSVQLTNITDTSIATMATVSDSAQSESESAGDERSVVRLARERIVNHK